MAPARRDGVENKDLHDAIFAPAATQGRNSDPTVVDCESPNSFLDSMFEFAAQVRTGRAHPIDPKDLPEHFR